MKSFKTRNVIYIVVLGLILNLAGKKVPEMWNLPIWMDSFGTTLSAYVLGPVGGAAVGLTSNIIYNILHDTTMYLYGIINAAIGIIVGLCARRGSFKNLFGIMTVSAMITIICIAISTPLNLYYYDGMVGNPFGDGVAEYLMKSGVNKYIACAIGDFYIEFSDKIVTFGLFGLVLLVVRKVRKSRTVSSLIITMLALTFAFASSKPLTVHAADDGIIAEQSEDGEESADDEESGEEDGDAFISRGPDKDTLDFYSYFQTLYNAKNGLSCGTANDIAETNDGILWVGTYAGLYRYNGRDFRLMKDFGSVKNVNCLYVDPEGRLWIGTNDNGLAVSVNENVTNTIDMSNGLPSNSVRSIVMSSDGYYYIGTSSSLQILQLRGGMRIKHEIEEIKNATSLSADNLDHVAAVTSDGKLQLLYNAEIIGKPRECPGDDVFTSCYFRKDGTLCATGSRNIIYLFEIKDNTLMLKGVAATGKLNHINSVYETEDGFLLACTDSGVGFFDKNMEFKTINTNEFNNSIDKAIMDYQGNFWLISSRQGMLRLSPSVFSNIYGYSGLDNKVVNAVANWNNKLYIGTDDGLDVLNSEGMAIYVDPLQKHLSGIRIRQITPDSSGNLWVSTYGHGLLKYTGAGKVKWFNAEEGFSDWIRCCAQLDDGTMVSAGDSGLAYIKDDKIIKQIAQGKDFLESRVLCLLSIGDGRMIAGSDGDGMAIVKDGVVERKITSADGLSSNVILRIVEAKKNGGYFIVTSNGLCYMDREGNIRILDQFPYYNNYDIWELDDGEAFVLGSAGIYVMDEDDIIANTGEAQYEFLDAKRGLLDTLTVNAWNCMDGSGDLFLSTDVGVYVLNLKDFGSDKNSYRMKVTSVVLDGVKHQVERGTDIILDRETVRLEIKPEIINYTVEDPIVQYWLNGFDSKMTEVNASELESIVYTNLPTGDFTFEMRIIDNDGNILEESFYSIVKEKKIYDYWWFKIYMIMVAGVAVAWFTWFIARTNIQRTLRYQERELEIARKQLEMGEQTILAIAKAVDAKDENTSLHSQRVSEYSAMLARELGFDDEQCENIRRAGLLHDIGKIGIPDRVLNKKGRLDDEEYELMKSHVVLGGEILKDFTLIEHAADGAMYHHEKYDGTGYAQKLKGEEIPLYGRIIAVADAFDAMTQNRVYREKQDISYVKEELKRCSGTQFDPKIAEIMLRFIDEGVVPIGDNAMLRRIRKHELEEEQKLKEMEEHEKN